MPSSTSNMPLIVEGDMHTNNSSRPLSVSSNFSRSVSSESGEDANIELENSSHNIPIFHSDQRGRRKRKGLVSSSLRARRVNDPFDYEQKYPEDEEFKEMGLVARVWKVFLDEFAKFDTDRVEDWRDSLDVLLVFAGLFSAVVTTFVVQTCQSLEVDKIEIGVSLLYEIAGLARVIAEGGDAREIPRSILTPSSPARPSFTDTWVNALWFTSLALSLTTALLAVLTKQWIHQYMILPSGTPLDRSRIRQFRYDNLETWRVGVIVGLLPVLMHVSLGVFFAGLVLYLYKLSVPISEVVGLIAAFAFVVYFGTTFLPIYKPTCPYKTPLTSYSYSISYYLGRLMAYPGHWICGTKGSNVVGSQRPSLSFPKLFEAPVPKQTGPASLKTVEKKLVRADAERLDARALSWLYKISSNSSVQRIVMQALANIPLQSIHIVQRKVAHLDDAIRDAIRLSDWSSHAEQRSYERFLRALVRFDQKEDLLIHDDVESRAVFYEQSLGYLLNDNEPEGAVAFLQTQLSASAPLVQMDVLSWAKVFQNALTLGADWLEIDVESSPIWSAFIRPILRGHPSQCKMMRCEQSQRTLCVLPSLPDMRIGRIWSRRHTRDLPPIQILESPNYSSTDTLSFTSALSHFMHSSTCEALLFYVFPDYCIGDDFKDIPSDIRLHLALLQSPHVHRTSRPRGKNGHALSLMDSVIDYVHEYMGTKAGWKDNWKIHKGVYRATFQALSNVVSSNFCEDAITSADKEEILQLIFRALVRDRTLCEAYKSWLSPSIIDTIMHIVFSDPARFSCAVVADMLAHLSLSECDDLTLAVYTELSHRRWLEAVPGDFLFNPSRVVWGSDWESPEAPYFALAASFIAGLGTVRTASPSVYDAALKYLHEASNLLILGTIMILSDVSRSKAIAELVGHVSKDVGTTLLLHLLAYIGSANGKSVYTRHSGTFSETRPPFHATNNDKLSYDSLEDLEIMLHRVMAGKPDPGSLPLQDNVRPEAKNSVWSKRCMRLIGWDKEVAGSSDGTKLV